MVSTNTIIGLLRKTLIAGSINVIIFIITIILMAVVPDGNQLFIVIPLGVLDGMTISKIVKHDIDKFLTVILIGILVIAESVIILMLVLGIKEIIKPVNSLFLYIYKDVSWNHFLGNYICGIIFIILVLAIFIYSILMAYASKP